MTWGAKFSSGVSLMEILAGATVKSTSLFDGSLRLDAADDRMDEALTEAESILTKKVIAFNSQCVLRLCLDAVDHNQIKI